MFSNLKIDPVTEDTTISGKVENNRYSIVTIGRGSYITSASLDWGSFRSNIIIGRYSSIAQRVVFEVGFNHDHHYVSTYPFRELLVYQNSKDDDNNHFYENNHYQIIIGNDVWIGEGAKVIGGGTHW